MTRPSTLPGHGGSVSRSRTRFGRTGLEVVAVLLAATSTISACASSVDAVTETEPLLVAGAADLRPAFTELGRDFEAATGERVVFNFGSSGQLAQQLIEGAPMDVYASADVAFVDRVLDAGVGDPGTQQTYAFGRIVIWSGDTRWADWTELTDVVDDPDVATIAIANPEHAPYGRAAQQALEAAGLWDRARPKLVFGENVADAQRLAASGNAHIAIVALSLALAADEEGEGDWVLVDEALHRPLQQDLVVVATDPDRAELARRFVDHVNSAAGREVMRRYGFLLPGEPPPPAWSD